MRACVCMRECACVRACVRVGVGVCVCVCVRARAILRAFAFAMLCMKMFVKQTDNFLPVCIYRHTPRASLSGTFLQENVCRKSMLGVSY